MCVHVGYNLTHSVSFLSCLCVPATGQLTPRLTFHQIVQVPMLFFSSQTPEVKTRVLLSPCLNVNNCRVSFFRRQRFSFREAKSSLPSAIAHAQMIYYYLYNVQGLTSTSVDVRRGKRRAISLFEAEASDTRRLLQLVRPQCAVCRYPCS